MSEIVSALSPSAPLSSMPTEGPADVAAVSKTKFVLARPNLSVREILCEAAAAGVELTSPYVYKIRVRAGEGKRDAKRAASELQAKSSVAAVEPVVVAPAVVAPAVVAPAVVPPVVTAPITTVVRRTASGHYRSAGSVIVAAPGAVAAVGAGPAAQAAAVAQTAVAAPKPAVTVPVAQTAVAAPKPAVTVPVAQTAVAARKPAVTVPVAQTAVAAPKPAVTVPVAQTAVAAPKPAAAAPVVVAPTLGRPSRARPSSRRTKAAPVVAKAAPVVAKAAPVVAISPVSAPGNDAAMAVRRAVIELGVIRVRAIVDEIALKLQAFING